MKQLPSDGRLIAAGAAARLGLDGPIGRDTQLYRPDDTS